MTTIRVKACNELPVDIAKWLVGRSHTQQAHNGSGDECFDVVDVTFYIDIDGMTFKLMFPDVAFTSEEIKISDFELYYDDHDGNAEWYEKKNNEGRSRIAALRLVKLAAYERMWDNELKDPDNIFAFG